MRFIKRILVVDNQTIVVLKDGKPCSHCRNKKPVPLSDHLVSWEIQRALIVYAGEDVDAICVDCLKEVLEC